MNLLLAPVYADTVSLTVSDPAENFTTVGNLFAFVVNLVLGIGWALVFVMLALGFVQYVMSKGEKTAVDSAQKWLTYAVIGGVGLFFIGFFRRIIPQLLGVDDLTTGGNLSEIF